MIDLSPVPPILFAGTTFVAVVLFYGLLQLPALFDYLDRKIIGSVYRD